MTGHRGNPHVSVALALGEQPQLTLRELAVSAWRMRERCERLEAENAQLQVELAGYRAGQLDLLAEGVA